MTFQVRHAENDYRLHDPDGTEIGTGWDHKAGPTEMAGMVASEFGGASLWAENPQRGYMVDITTGGVRYRDLTVPGETVPWED